MCYLKQITKSALYAALSLTILSHSATALAEKEMQATQQVEPGAKLQIKPEISTFSPVEFQFSLDPLFQDGIFLPMDLGFGETYSIYNATFGDKGKNAILLLERLPEGELLVRLENHQNFNSEECEEEKKYPPGWAHGESLGTFCLRSGLMLMGKGIFQSGIFPKFDDNEGLRFRSEDADYSYAVKEKGGEQHIEFHKIYRLLLPPGGFLTLRVENLPEHVGLTPKSKFLYHLAETGKNPDMPFQSSRVGILTFQSLFDFNTDGTTLFERTVTPGDVITLEGDEDGKGVAIYTDKTLGGSKLEIRSYNPHRRPLRRIRINGENPISLEPLAPVTIVSQGGDAGYWSPELKKAKSIPAAKTLMALHGASWPIEFFTTLDNSSLDLKKEAPEGPSDQSPLGPQDWDSPKLDPAPTPAPTSSPAPDSKGGDVDSNNDIPPHHEEGEFGKDSGIDSDAISSEGGWACSLKPKANPQQRVIRTAASLGFFLLLGAWRLRFLGKTQ